MGALSVAATALFVVSGGLPARAADVSSADHELHERLIVLDTHLDTPGQLDRPGWSIMDRHSLQSDPAQVDYPRMVDGSVDGGFWAIFTYQRELTVQGYDTARSQALKRAEQIRRMVADNPAHFVLATEAEDASRIVSQGKRIVYVSIENAYPLGTDMALLEKFHALGVRMIGLVHTSDNQFADSATDERRTWHGLSPAGLALGEEANRLGMIIDASHASDEAFDQMLARSRAPIILSHSGCDAIYDHPRNIDDGRLRALAAAGGVIQMNTLGAYLKKLPETPERDREMAALRARFPPLASMTPGQVAQYMVARQEIGRRHPPARATFEDFMRHMLHAIEVAGIDHVGIGADWDGGGGVDGLEDVSRVPRITARLREEGFSEKQIAKVMGGNTLRVLCEARRTASGNAISGRPSLPACSARSTGASSR